VATTLPQHFPISLQINSVCGHYTNSTHRNLTSGLFTLWPTHHLSQSQSPYTLIQFVTTTLHQHIPISLHINSVCGHYTALAIPISLHINSVCRQNTASAHSNLTTQLIFWTTYCISTTQTPDTLIQFLANTLPQDIPKPLHINSGFGHHTASVRPNLPTQFSL
jgi:hypothetical protein